MGESIGQKGKGGKKGRNDWRDKEEGGEVYDLTNLSGEDTPLIFVYILASFMEILGKVEKLASSIFSREKLRARETIVKLLGEPRCFIGNRAIYGAEDARQPPPSF